MRAYIYIYIYIQLSNSQKFQMKHKKAEMHSGQCRTIDDIQLLYKKIKTTASRIRCHSNTIKFRRFWTYGVAYSSFEII